REAPGRPLLAALTDALRAPDLRVPRARLRGARRGSGRPGPGAPRGRPRDRRRRGRPHVRRPQPVGPGRRRAAVREGRWRQGAVPGELVFARDQGDAWLVAVSLAKCAGLDLAVARPERATRLFGAVARWQATVDARDLYVMGPGHDDDLATARRGLPGAG